MTQTLHDVVVERFSELVSVEPTTGCWIWMLGLNNGGYGSVRVDGQVTTAHRAFYAYHRGSIPDGFDIDHLCRHRWCVNPAHLEAVTRRENIMRGVGFGAVFAKRTACSRGHEFTEANTRIGPDGRRCRTCERAYGIAFRRRHPGYDKRPWRPQYAMSKAQRRASRVRRGLAP